MVRICPRFLCCCLYRDEVGVLVEPVPASVRISAPDRFVAAAKAGDVELVKTLLASGVDVNSRLGVEGTALHVAAVLGHTQLAAVLLDKGADIHVKTPSGETPIALACYHNRLATIRQLLERGANVSDRHTGKSLLLLAYTSGYYEIVKCLLEFKADVNEQYLKHEPLLVQACREGLRDYVELFLRYNADVNIVDRDGLSPLMISLSRGRQEIVHMLEEQGASIQRQKRQECMDGYRFLELLGCGGSGQVSKVQDLETGQIYAHKEIMCNDDYPMDVALGEVRFLVQSLSHPNIVKYHKCYTTRCEGETLLCLVMELCEYGTLESFVVQSGNSRITDKQMIGYVKQVCEALQYLHEQNVVHGDLKPSNIFITENNNIKLGDFGLARTVGSASAGQSDRWAPPEAFIASEDGAPIGQSVDMWGVGVSVLQLCGVPLERPYCSFMLGEQMTREPEEEAARLRLGLEIKGHSDALSDLVLGLLAVDAEKRPTAAQVLRRLSELVESDDVDRAGRTYRACETFVNAADNGDLATVSAFLCAGAPADMACLADGIGEVTPLYAAVKGDHRETVRALLRHGARPDVASSFAIGHENTITPIALAARLHRKEVLAMILEAIQEAEEEEMKGQGERLVTQSLEEVASDTLLLAAVEGYEEIMRLLVEHSANVVSTRTMTGNTPLILAARGGHTSSLKYLLSQGADVDAKNSLNETALMVASRNGCGDAVVLLLENGADKQEVNDTGETAARLAEFSGHLHLAQFIRNFSNEPG